MTATSITEAKFWSLLAKGRKRGATSACDCCVARYLKKLSDEEVFAFGLMLYEKVCDLNTWRIWGAGEVIMPSMSDDSFHYFRTWIVGCGKEAYELAMREPDALGPFVDDAEGNIDNEALEYSALKVLKERGIEDDFRDRASRDADDAPDGEPFNLETLSTTYPRLAAQSRNRPGGAPSEAEITPGVQSLAFRYTAAWCSQIPAAVAKLYAPEGSLCINGGVPSIGREAIAATVQSFMTAFPNLHLAMGQLIRMSDRVEYHWRLTGNNTGPGGTGAAVNITGYESWLLDQDGHILDSQGHFDAEDYHRQLTAKPSTH